MLNKTVCVCGLVEADVLGEKDGRTVGRCEVCNMVRTLEVASDYGTFYTEGLKYHAERDGQTPYLERFDHDRNIAAQRLQRHLPMTDLRVLDVGCANGGFVSQAMATGVRTEGLELNPAMAAIVRETTGALVHEDWSSVLGQFTLITYHDVLEHVIDPVAELQRASAYLAPRGVLVVDAPDVDDPRFAELGMNWHHMKPLEHLWFFNRESLRAVFRRAGLSPFKVEHPIQGKVVMYGRR